MKIFPTWNVLPTFPRNFDPSKISTLTVIERKNIKGWSSVGASTGTLKNPTKFQWSWESYYRINVFFFSPPPYLCSLTRITEISLNVKLSNRSTQWFKNVAGVDIFRPVNCLTTSLLLLLNVLYLFLDTFLFFFYKGKSIKFQGVFKVKSRVKTRQVQRIWSQQFESQKIGRNQATEQNTCNS